MSFFGTRRLFLCSMNAKKSEMYLFFDTETTGLPILNSVPAEGFYIPDEAVAIHGITTAYARYWGERLERVLHVFNKSLRMADYVVCHNAWYDTNVVMGSDDQEDKVVYIQDVPDDGLSPLERWIDDMLVMLDKKR